MSQLCCCKSYDEGVYAVQDPVFRQSFKCCCCYVDNGYRCQTTWGSTFIGAGTAIGICFVINSFTTELRADILWLFAGIIGVLIFTVGLLLLACIPVMKLVESYRNKRLLRRHLTPQLPMPGNLVHVQRIGLAQPQAPPVNLPVPHRVRPQCGLIERTIMNQSLQGGRVACMVPHQCRFETEGIQLEDSHVLSEQASAPQTGLTAPQYPTVSVQGDLTIAARDFSTQHFERKVLRRSLSLNSGLDNFNRIVSNLPAVATGPPVVARLVKVRPLVFYSVTEETSPKSEAVMCTRRPPFATQTNVSEVTSPGSEAVIYSLRTPLGTLTNVTATTEETPV